MIGMSDAEFGVLMEQFDKPIRGIARKLSGQSEDLYDELYQVGLIALWRDVDPSRSHTNLSSMVRKAVKCRMIDFLRAYKPNRYQSMEEMFDNGWQLSHVEEATLVRNTPRGAQAIEFRQNGGYVYNRMGEEGDIEDPTQDQS